MAESPSFRDAEYNRLYERATESGVCHRPKGTVPGPVRICGAKGKVKCAECGAPMCGRKGHDSYCYVCHQVRPQTVMESTRR